MASDRVIAMKNAQAQEDMARNYDELKQNYDVLIERLGNMSAQLEAVEDLLDGKLDRLIELLTTTPENMAQPADKSQKKDK